MGWREEWHHDPFQCALLSLTSPYPLLSSLNVNIFKTYRDAPTLLQIDKVWQCAWEVEKVFTEFTPLWYVGLRKVLHIDNFDACWSKGVDIFVSIILGSHLKILYRSASRDLPPETFRSGMCCRLDSPQCVFPPLLYCPGSSSEFTASRGRPLFYL